MKVASYQIPVTRKRGNACGIVGRAVLCFLLVTGCWSLVTGEAHAAAERRLEATLEMQRVAVGNPVYLNVVFHGAQDVDRPEIQPVNGLQIKYVGPSTRVSVVNGRVSQSVSHNFLIMPLKEGDYEFGPFRVQYQGDVYVAPPVHLIVEGGSAYRSAPSSQPRAQGPSPQSQAASQAPMPGGGPVPPDDVQRKAYQSDRVFLTMVVPKRKVYVNEAVPIVIKLYGTGVGLKDIEYPAYGHDGFSTGDFPEPEKGQELYHGVDYNTLIFKQEMFGVKEGQYTLGPAKMNCTMLIRQERARRSSAFGRSIFDDDFFGSVLRTVKEYPIELSSDEIQMTVLPLPEVGKPEGFQGAVGDFTFEVQADTRKVKVGDPITVRMTISGQGNMDTVTAPEIQESEYFKVYEPQSSKKGNKKIYEQVIIPKTSDAKEIPAVTFSFFSPEAGAYRSVTKGPIPIEVIARPEGEAPIKMVTAAQGAAVTKSEYAEEKLGKDIVYIKENPGKLEMRGSYLFKSPVFWGAQAVPLVLLCILFFSRRKEEKIRTDKRYARSLKAPRKAKGGIAKAKALIGKKDPVQFYDTIFKTLQEYIGDKFNLPKGAVTSQVIDEKLRPAGYDEERLRMLKEIFDACEMARYASLIPDAMKESEVLEKLEEVIDYFEKTRV